MLQRLSAVAIALDLPAMIDERLVKVFQSYCHGRLRRLMQTEQAIYELVQEFPADHRSQALALARRYHSYCRTAITVADDRYRVWVDTSYSLYLSP